jgi:rod shape-determining protein MreD
MIITYIHRIGWFIGLVLLQVLILNNVHIAGYATPFLYIYFILKFASGTSRNELMLWAFFFGLTIDIFADTPDECCGNRAAGFPSSVLAAPVYSA